MPVLSMCLGLAALAGCGSTITALPKLTTAPIAPGTTTYHSYGDSISAGVGVSSPTAAYPSLIAADLHLGLTRFAVSGAEACDVPTRQIFPGGDSPAGTTFPLYTLMIGTNDADLKGVGAYETNFNLCQQASIAWLALPVEWKVLATSPAVLKTGPGSIETAGGWNSWQTGSKNAQVIFPITLLGPGPVYIWRRLVDGDAGLYSVAVDGTALGTFSTSTPVPIFTNNFADNSLGLLRISGISAGPHTVTFTQTSASGTMRIVAVGAPPPAALKKPLPTLIVGSIPLQLLGSGSPCSVNPSLCNQYNADVTANAAIFMADGLDVRLADNHTYMHGTAAEMADWLHPGSLGQSELREAFEAWIP